MRTSEQERLIYLQDKYSRGEEFTPKEKERFESLTLQARSERMRMGEKFNGNRIESGSRTDTSLPINAGGSADEIGGKSGSGATSEREFGTTADDDAIETDRTINSGTDPIFDSGERNRDNDGSYAATSGEITDGSGENNGSSRTDAPGSSGNRGRKARIDATQNPELANLKPNDVAPKRRGNSKGTSNKAVGGDTTADTFATIFVAGFGLLAAVTGREHWAISEKEGVSLAAPLETMIAKLPAKTKKKLEEISAPAIFGAALAQVVIPRAMIDFSTMKGNKGHVRNTIKAESIGASNVTESIGLHKNGGNSADTENSIPSADPAITGLFS